MTCWSTDEDWNTILVLAVLQMDHWCVLSERMLVSLLSVSVDPREMSWAETALAQTPLCGDLKTYLKTYIFLGIFTTKRN